MANQPEKRRLEIKGATAAFVRRPDNWLSLAYWK